MDEDLKIVEELRQELAETKEKFKYGPESLTMQSIIDYRTKQAQALEHLVQAYKQQADIIKNSVSKDKLKEIVDECIPRGKNIITKKEEYQTNANANSYLAQEILRLLEGK